MNRWRQVAVGASVSLALGVPSAWSVFVRPVEQEFGWTRAQTYPAFAGVAFAFAFLLGARIQDKRGPFWPTLAGGILLSAGLLMCGWTTTLGWLAFWLGGVAYVGSGLAYSVPIAVAAKWFPERRGLVVALALAAYGTGSLVFGPLAAGWLIPSYGWRTDFVVVALTVLVMTAAGAFLLRDPPERLQVAGGFDALAPAGTPSTTREFSPTKMLRTRRFLFLWAGFALATSGTAMVTGRFIPFARSVGLGAEWVNVVVFTMAIGNLGGLIVSGRLSDALGRLTILRVVIAVSAVILFAIFRAGSSAALLLLSVFAVCYCQGTLHSVNASAVADFWGTRNLAVNYWLLWTAPWLGTAGVMAVKLQSHQAVSSIAAVLALLAVGCVLLARRPEAPATEQASG